MFFQDARYSEEGETKLVSIREDDYSIKRVNKIQYEQKKNGLPSKRKKNRKRGRIWFINV